jgi:hypothetical protein
LANVNLEGCIKSMQQQLGTWEPSQYSSDDRGKPTKPESRWTVVGTSGYTLTINHSNIRLTLRLWPQLNPSGVTTVLHKYSLIVARHAAVVVAVPSTVHYPSNYKIKIYYLK